jgi:hypothetical protein
VATIEMIGIIPLAVMIAGAIIQLYLVGYAAVKAESAARLAAREASQGTAYAAAEGMAYDQFPGGSMFDPQFHVAPGDQSETGEEPSVDGSSLTDEVSAKATLTVPFLGIGIKGLDIHVTRYAVMPMTD